MSMKGGLTEWDFLAGRGVSGTECFGKVRIWKSATECKLGHVYTAGLDAQFQFVLQTGDVRKRAREQG